MVPVAVTMAVTVVGRLRRLVDNRGLCGQDHPRHRRRVDDRRPGHLDGVDDAVGDQVEVLLDGGIRRGSDVVKALALGATAVLIGRAYLWGLAANGQAGVENVLDVLRGGIDSTLLALGHRSVHDLTRDDVRIPETFPRALGAGTTSSV